MHNIKRNLLRVAIAMAFLPVVANAASLGKLTINSNVGEPLNAEIELVSVAKDELASLTANIATEETYALQGMQRNQLLKEVRLDFARRADGTVILKLASNQPVNTAALDMLIVLNTLGGRALNEYTLYIPQATPKPVQPVQAITMPAVPAVSEQPIATAPNIYRESASPTGAALPTATAAVEQPPVKAAPPIQVSGYVEKPAKPLPQSAETTDNKYTVKAGDTLNKIAKEIPLEEFSFQQLLVGLFKNNKSAFEGSNMNRLRTGKIIVKPESEVIKAIPQREAVETIAVQAQEYGQWRSYDGPNMSARVAVGKITNSGPVLKLSGEKIPDAPNGNPNAQPSSDKPTDNVASAQELAEDTTAKNNELLEAQDRIAALEKQLQDMQALLALKSKAAAVEVPPTQFAPPPVEESNPVNNMIAKAKEKPMFAGGVLGGIGLLSLMGFIRRKKSKTAKENLGDPEIEGEMNSIHQATVRSNLGTPGSDDID